MNENNKFDVDVPANNVAGYSLTAGKYTGEKNVWIPPDIPPSDDRDVLVKLEEEGYDTLYKVCHYENGKWWHLFRGYQTEPMECPWIITAWKDIN